MMMNTDKHRADVLAATALRVLGAQSYAVGRPHYCEIVAERLFHMVVNGETKGARNGRCTLLDIIAKCWRAAGNDARAEMCVAISRSLMGLWLDGNTRDMCTSDQKGVHRGGLALDRA